MFTPHCWVQSKPVQPETTRVCSPSQYQSRRAASMDTPPMVSWLKVVWPERQCTRQVGEKTPVVAGREAMRARVPVWNCSTNEYWAGVAGA